MSKNPKQENGRDFTTVSGMPIEELHGPERLEGLDLNATIGRPGEPPYTRGIHPDMYRGRRWTMRQFSGFGTAADTNRRYKYLLQQGQTGLSVAFDLPTLMGRDSIDPLAYGEVGREGVAIATLADMETLFEGIPLEKVSTSMTINSPAAILLAMYLAVAENQGADWKKLRGTIQNDILKEYIAQKEWIYPPAPSLRIITDIMRFCLGEVPQWNTISISGYHIREAGSTAVQELAFTLVDGLTYVEEGIRAGMNVDDFAPRLSFFFNVHNDFFEEIAKYRAARRMWCRFMQERFGAKNPKSWKLRTHAQTAGCSLTAQQPYNNVVRVTVQALAAVLGGVQSLHTNSLDETLALPTEKAVTIALRTQQVLAEESGVANTVDPLGGSWFLESMTNRMEAEANSYIEKIDSMGGMVAAIEAGFPQKEIAEASYWYQRQLEDDRKIIVGVNRYDQNDEEPIPVLKISDQVEKDQVRNLKRVRANRDDAKVRVALGEVQRAARGTDNLMPGILDAVRAYATVGEICDALKEIFGEYREKVVHF
jgi:methylmalonyl-CoA mutase N-terminal domain/subunit